MLRQEDDVKKTAAGKKQSDEIGGIHLQVNKEPEQEAQQEPGSKNQVKLKISLDSESRDNTEHSQSSVDQSKNNDQDLSNTLGNLNVKHDKGVVENLRQMPGNFNLSLKLLKNIEHNLIGIGKFGMSSDPEVKFRAEELENSMGQFSNNQDIGKEIGNSKATQDKRVLDDLMFANSEVCQRLKNIDHKVIEKINENAGLRAKNQNLTLENQKQNDIINCFKGKLDECKKVLCENETLKERNEILTQRIERAKQEAETFKRNSERFKEDYENQISCITEKQRCTKEELRKAIAKERELEEKLKQMKLSFDAEQEYLVTRSNWLRDQALPTDDLVALYSKKYKAHIAILNERNEHLKIEIQGKCQDIKELEKENEKLKRESKCFIKRAHELRQHSSKVKKNEEKLEHKAQRRFAKIKTGQDKIIQEMQKHHFTEADKLKLVEELEVLQAITACGKVDLHQFLMNNRGLHCKIQELNNASVFG